MLARSSLAFTQSILGTKRECIQEKDELDEGHSLIHCNSVISKDTAYQKSSVLFTISPRMSRKRCEVFFGFVFFVISLMHRTPNFPITKKECVYLTEIPKQSEGSSEE